MLNQQIYRFIEVITPKGGVFFCQMLCDLFNEWYQHLIFGYITQDTLVDYKRLCWIKNVCVGL